jgi:hypothetical protein
MYTIMVSQLCTSIGDRQVLKQGPPYHIFALFESFFPYGARWCRSRRGEPVKAVARVPKAGNHIRENLQKVQKYDRVIIVIILACHQCLCKFEKLLLYTLRLFLPIYNIIRSEFDVHAALRCHFLQKCQP